MDRCALCPGKFNCVSGDGPEDSPYFLLGEACGKEENSKGRPFIGKTGREVNEHYLPLAGLRRDGVRIDNCISCFPDRPKGKLDPKRKADIDLLYSCAEHHLYPYLDRVKPKLIVPMGSFACRAIDPDIDLELQHGMPVQTSFGTAFPMYHPALGIHSPKQMLNIRTDWIRLRRYITGKLRQPKDQYAGQERYEHVQTAARVREILHAAHDSPLACDTESTRAGVPFCITFSVEPGTGYLIRAEDSHTLSALQAELDRWTGHIIWHNWLYDGSVVAKMGLKYPRRLIRDTMSLAFTLGNLPQGLKALSYRELGMKMQDFDDLVSPHSAKLVLDYYRNAYTEEWPTPDPQLTRQEGGGWKMYKPQNFHTKLKRFFSDYEKKQGDKDPFEMWTKNWEDAHSMIEERLGHWPGKCITHVPFDEVIHYACLSRDSRVSTPTGYMNIGDIVRNQYTGPVHSYNPQTDRIEERKVTNHYRMKSESKIQWVSLMTEHTRLGRWGLPGTRYTPDHKLLTPQGMRPIGDIRASDQIYLPIHKLSDTELQVVYGSLLGDGTVSKRNIGGWGSLHFTHCERQWPYALWKLGLIDNLSPTTWIGQERDLFIEGKLAHATKHMQVSTQHHPELSTIRGESFVVKGYKNLGSWIHHLSWLALAVWYQDDGTLAGKCPRFYTLGFIKDEVDMLRSILLSLFGLETTSYETSREGQWAIAVRACSAPRFFFYIAPYVHPCLSYKIPLEYQGQFEDLKSSPSKGLVLSTVRDVFPNPVSDARRGSNYFSYCIDVDETHNFLTMDEVAKNCRDSDATLRLWPLLNHMRRNVRVTSQDRWLDGYDA